HRARAGAGGVPPGRRKRWARVHPLVEPGSRQRLLEGRRTAREGVPAPIAFLLLGSIAGVIIGVAIGATGIGGVLLVPVLAYILGVPVPTAIAVALWSYLWSGLVAVRLYARHGSVPWRPALWLCLAAAP